MKCLSLLLVSLNMYKVLVICALCLCQALWAPSAEGARILVLFPPPAPSHFILGNALVKGLVQRGHDVTFISSFGSKQNATNIKDIVLPIDKEQMETFQASILTNNEKSVVSQMMHFFQMTGLLTESTFLHPQVQELVHSDTKFDLVIMETFLNEAHAVFAHHFDCPLLVVSTMGSNIWVNKMVGNQNPSSYVPQPLGAPLGDMSFWARLSNFLVVNTVDLIYSVLQLRNQDELMRKYFPDAPPLGNIIHDRISLILLNSHPSISPAKPMVPNMVEIGGFHVTEPKPLPKDLQQYLDSAKNGFILFSMGSNLKSTMLPVETREAIMKTFAQLPYKILWKFEDDKLPGKPDNVRIDKWLPQNDILAHPNLKLFITHGGLLSTTEAIYHGVPIVGIPVFGDQKMNMASSEALGIGKAVQFKELSTETLLAAIQEVLGNKNYLTTARQRSALFRDQPIRPLDSAMYWIEFVLKHKYADHLKVGAVNLYWYQVESLDVAAFLLSVVFGINGILFLIVRKCCCSSKQKYSSQKQNKKKRQ